MFPFHANDMTDFDPRGHRFDVVTCLFSVIVLRGRRSTECASAVRRVWRAQRRSRWPALARAVVHARDVLDPATWSRNSVDRPDLKISWMYVVAAFAGSASRILDIHFQIGTFEWHHRSSAELHSLGLFTNDEYVGAFQASGLHVKHRLDEIFSRGLYIGVKTE